MRYACRLVVLNLSGLSGKSSGEDLTLVDSMWWPESYRAMFIRVKKIGPYEYLYLVENAREGGRHVQRVIKALGRRDAIEGSDLLDGLIASAARHSRRSISALTWCSGDCGKRPVVAISCAICWPNGTSPSMSSGPST